MTILQIPGSVDEWKQISAKFEDTWNFSNCVWAIDGKHVVLQAPVSFPLSNYLMKPYSGIYDKSSPQRIFNYRLRRVVENAFGIISSVFQVLRKPMLL